MHVLEFLCGFEDVFFLCAEYACVVFLGGVYVVVDVLDVGFHYCAVWEASERAECVAGE